MSLPQAAPPPANGKYHPNPSGANGNLPSNPGQGRLNGSIQLVPAVPTIPNLPGHVDTQQLVQSAALETASYVYQAGFIHAAWSDTLLELQHHPPLRVHSLFISQCPLLYQYLSLQPGPPFHISLSIPDENITTIALSMAISTLYGHPLELDLESSGIADDDKQKFQLGKSLIATGLFLGLDKVASFGRNLLRQSISEETLLDLFKFILQPSQQQLQQQSSNPGSRSTSNSTTPSAATPPRVINPAVAPNNQEILPNHEGPYPPYTCSFLPNLLSHLLNTISEAQTNNQEAKCSDLPSNIQIILTILPFTILKNLLENDTLKFKNQMSRHSFARDVISLRKLRNLEMNKFFEESVVLSFGGGKNGVEIIRKSINGRRKQLWKTGY